MSLQTPVRVRRHPHVQFDERRRETAPRGGLRHRRFAKAAGPATPRACRDRARLRLYTESQRSQAGCSAGRMQRDFHHGLLDSLNTVCRDN